jgi:hypothetical protein
MVSCSSDEPAAPTQEPSDSAVLVYMVATNSLGSAYTIGDTYYDCADKLDLEEMQQAAKAGALGNGEWIIYHASYDGTKLMKLTESGLVTLKEYETGVSTSAARMTQVINDFKSFAAAKSYGIVLWSHANGWLQDGIDESATAATLSFGSDRSKRMNITTLADVLKPAGFQYIYFDCCLMGSIEVMYQLRECAEYIVSSPSELPRDGMPYTENMSLLLKGDKESLIAAARNTFNFYDSQDDEYNRTATMTVVATDKLAALATATANIYDITPLPHPLIRVTNYYGNALATEASYLDFGEYVNALADNEKISSELTAAYNLAMNDAVVYHAATPKLWGTWTLSSTSGLSTRVFNSSSNLSLNGYEQLDWTADVVAHHIR